MGAIQIAILFIVFLLVVEILVSFRKIKNPPTLREEDNNLYRGDPRDER